jgi:DNA-binding NarL/FixJ family response regulator
MSEAETKKAVMCGIAAPYALRDRSILEDIKSGMTIGAVADKHRISERTVQRVKRTYLNG